MGAFTSTPVDDVYQHVWTDRNQWEPPSTATDSPLLALGRSSDVDPLLPEQVAQARWVLQSRRFLVEGGRQELHDDVVAAQREIVERFLSGRRDHFGPAESTPLPEAATLAAEGRDIFVVVKYMDEAPHIGATLDSLVHQDVDLTRVVVVAVDNNSTDGSSDIVRERIERHRDRARIVYLNQSRPGAGNAARLGVDTVIATVHEMCRLDGQWERLQRATVAVTDGDTVYHPSTLRMIAETLDGQPLVDGVMPFLTYKFTAALRLFRNHRPARVAELRAAAGAAVPTAVECDLSTIRAHDDLPRDQRVRVGDQMELRTRSGAVVRVPLAHCDELVGRFGVLVDPCGWRGYVLADRTLVLEEAPVSGLDAALAFLENGRVDEDEKWRWHAVVGHDVFLQWAFEGMGIPVGMVFPDTSDALKTFRVWAFAIGGQHQLRRPGLRIATGSDYQSGRVLQAVGCRIRLGPPDVFAETETDRLIKMVRNFLHEQSVFYGETRGPALERATGLYVHMTRIQNEIERELLERPDTFFEHTVFPERVLFPLRWLLQNAIRFYAQGDQEREITRERVLGAIFSPETVVDIEERLLTPAAMQTLVDCSYSMRQQVAEAIAEAVIGAHYTEIMSFYVATLRSALTAWRLPARSWEWLLEGVTGSRNAVIDRPPPVDPTVVWEGAEFEIDTERGQVVALRGAHA